MRLWSVKSYKCLEEYSVPDKARLIDFDFDESKVIEYVLCIILLILFSTCFHQLYPHSVLYLTVIFTLA